MNISVEGTDFLNAFDLLLETSLDEYQRDRLNLFSLRINGNSFDYNYLVEQLIDPMIDYAVSREVKRTYANKPATLSKKAREKFKAALKNEGELGELLLFCFLETHLNAPKILSKLELKTSTSMYVNGADGVHFLKLIDGNYQLIFGESKMYTDLKVAIDRALKSIYEFKNEINSKNESKSGISYEKALISDNLSKETFSDEEKEFLYRIIYPSRNDGFYVDDAFGLFIGFQVQVSEEEKSLPNSTFRRMIQKRILEKVQEYQGHIRTKIQEYELQGHDFYIYVLPFTDIEKYRKKILEEVVS